MFKVVTCARGSGDVVKGVEVRLESYTDTPNLWDSSIEEILINVSDDDGVICFPSLCEGLRYRLTITGRGVGGDGFVVFERFNTNVFEFSFDDAVEEGFVEELSLCKVSPFDFRSNFGRNHLKFIYGWGLDSNKIETALLVGSVRSGKTVAACLKFLLHILDHPEMPCFLMTAQTYRSLVRNVVGRFLDICRRFGLDVRFLKGEQLIELTNGEVKQEIVLAGLNDISSEERIRGLTVGGWLCDEVVICNDEAVKQGISRCSLSGSKIIWTTNADKPCGYVYENYVMGGGCVNDCSVFNFTMLDNIHVSMDYILYEFHSYPSSDLHFRRALLNEWVSADGLVYDVFDRSKHVRNYSNEGVSGLLSCADALVVGCDYGLVTVFGIGVHIFDESINDSRYVLLEESYYDGSGDNRSETDTHRVERLKSLIKKYRDGFGRNVFVNLPHDSSANLFSACEEDPFFRNVKVDLFKPNTEDEIQRISDLFFNERLLLNESCVMTINQISKYQWDGNALKRGVDKPRKVDDHCCDMLRGVVRPCANGVGEACFGLLYM